MSSSAILDIVLREFARTDPAVIYTFLFLTIAFVSGRLGNAAFLLAWPALGLAFGFGGGERRPLWAWACVIAVILSSLLAVWGAQQVWGQGHTGLTLSIALWMAPMVLLFPLRLSLSLFSLLIPVFTVHAGLVIGQGIYLHQRASGLIHNPNLAAGMLVLGLTYCLTSARYRLWAVPMIVALPFTGSRWGSVVALGLIGLIWLLKQTNWRPIMASLAIVTATIWLTWYLIPENYRLLESIGASVDRATYDTFHRLRAEDFTWTGLPMGVNGSDGIHSVAVRIFVEWGALAAVAWAGLTGYCLLRRPWGTAAWWLLLAWTGLGILDYYPIMGHFAAWWFVLTGMRLKEASKGAVPDLPDHGCNHWSRSTGGSG